MAHRQEFRVRRRRRHGRPNGDRAHGACEDHLPDACDRRHRRRRPRLGHVGAASCRRSRRGRSRSRCILERQHRGCHPGVPLPRRAARLERLLQKGRGLGFRRSAWRHQTKQGGAEFRRWRRRRHERRVGDLSAGPRAGPDGVVDGAGRASGSVDVGYDEAGVFARRLPARIVLGRRDLHDWGRHLLRSEVRNLRRLEGALPAACDGGLRRPTERPASGAERRFRRNAVADLRLPLRCLEAAAADGWRRG
mmetsp:Transcript_18332/g.52376  ORF Transcript_18332/g.52376 Transcript_18332/m.52376 type:complete len:250 (+) Transcript_18332:162-911(+)